MTEMMARIPTTTGFRLDDYADLVRRTAAAYPCVGFEVLESAGRSRFAILRHDIDMSPEQALALARIEAEQGVRTTFTVLLTGYMYSPFEASVRDLLRRILDLGHEIGLHFDANWHGISDESELESALTWEASALERLIGLSAGGIKMFSFHNTTPFTMNCRESHYGGLRNAYAGELQSTVQYTSDSNGYWIHRTWLGLLDEGHDRIQVLTHPEWWRNADAEPGEKVCATLSARQLASWRAYRETLKRGNRSNQIGLSIDPDTLTAVLGEIGERLLVLWLSGEKDAAIAAATAMLGGPAISLQGDAPAAERFEAILAAALAAGGPRGVSP